MQGEQKENRQKKKGKRRRKLEESKGERRYGKIKSLDKSREVIKTKAGD